MSTPISAAALGAAGLAPFLALAAIVLTGDESAARDAQFALILYGGVILSFLGGCRWGFAAAGLGSGPRFLPLALSTVFPLLAWAALFTIPGYGVAAAGWLLIAALAALYLWDLDAARQGAAPVWWARLRLPLTLGAMASLLAATLSG